MSDVDQEKLVENVVKLCAQPTITKDKNEYLCSQIVRDIFTEIGVDSIEMFEKDKGRSNLVARIKGKKKGSVLAIIGHTDVVPIDGQNWNSDPFIPVIKEGKIYARGAIDNKGPFAAAFEGVRIFIAKYGREFAGEIVLITAADEEMGSTYGVKYLFGECGMKCDFALVPDGGERGELIYGEMGALHIKFTTHGKAYHGSVPEKGINAIVPLAELLVGINKVAWTEMKGDPEFDHTVLNIGLIQGGTAANIVPDSAHFSAMWRYPAGITDKDIVVKVERVLVSVRKLYPKVKFGYDTLALSLPHIAKKDSILGQACQNACKRLGLKTPRLKTIRGLSVAKFVNQACGADVIVDGPMDGSEGLMHQPNENVDILSLVSFAKYYALVLEDMMTEK